jgi:ankyrin repeat domain-containing protein 42
MIIPNKQKVKTNISSTKSIEIFSILDLAFPAHVAAYNGDLEHIKLLIEQGVVHINERDERGATLAHKAAGQGHLHVLQWLIEMGASMELATQSGETPKDVARRFAQLACLKILGGGADNLETNQRRIKNESTRQGDRRKLTPKEEERRRAGTKLDELQKQVDIAKKNYRQLGGHLDDDQQREAIEQDTQKYLFLMNIEEKNFFLF